MAGTKGRIIASRRAQTHCKRGHPLFGDNLKINSQGYRTCKTCKRVVCAEYARKGRASGKIRAGYMKTVINVVGPELLKAAFDAARETGQIASVRAALGNRARWKAIRFFYPKIARTMDKIIGDAKLTIKRPARIVQVRGDVFDLISAAMPLHLSRDHRDDAIQNMWVAVKEGRVKHSEIASRAKEFVSAEYRINHDAWGPRSLDVPIYLEGNATLLDSLSVEMGTGCWDINMMASTGRRK